MGKITAEKLSNSIRANETLHMRAFIKGDTIKAAKHRRKIRDLKDALAQIEAAAQ